MDGMIEKAVKWMEEEKISAPIGYGVTGFALVYLAAQIIRGLI